MRYYEVYLPGKPEPAISTNVRALRDLPEGTRIQAIVTDSDGEEIVARSLFGIVPGLTDTEEYED